MRNIRTTVVENDPWLNLEPLPVASEHYGEMSNFSLALLGRWSDSHEVDEPVAAHVVEVAFQDVELDPEIRESNCVASVVGQKVNVDRAGKEILGGDAVRLQRHITFFGEGGNAFGLEDDVSTIVPAAVETERRVAVIRVALSGHTPSTRANEKPTTERIWFFFFARNVPRPGETNANAVLVRHGRLLNLIVRVHNLLS